MQLRFNLSLADNYKSNSQKARVLTEDWLYNNVFCPICGNEILSHFEANRPVADFICKSCQAEFELKSKQSNKGEIGSKIMDGAFNTMIERITSQNNPNFFFLTYANSAVNNLIMIPNHFFTPEIIIKRKPLAPTAKRAGWVGCNVNLDKIPGSGKIFLVKNSEVVNKENVMLSYKRIAGLKTSSLESRGWLMDILNCIDLLGGNFTLQQVYAFEDTLKAKHPNNRFVKDKIRQQLQLLRDKEIIAFTSRGEYRKL